MAAFRPGGTPPPGRDADPAPARHARVVTRARHRATLWKRSPRSRVAGIQTERRGCRLCLAALVENLDPALGSFELRVAEAGELYAALEELQRAFECEVALLERLDDRLELRDCGFEVLDGGGVGHGSSSGFQRFQGFQRFRVPRSSVRLGRV